MVVGTAVTAELQHLRSKMVRMDDIMAPAAVRLAVEKIKRQSAHQAMEKQAQLCFDGGTEHEICKG